MKLSTAIIEGRKLRPETHQGEMFSRLANLDTLGSDVWGAAVEAVRSDVAQRSWTELTLNSDKEYAAEILQRYFASYWKMPANCPGAKPLGYIEARERVINRRGETKVEGEKGTVIGTLTSECRHVLSLGQLVGHMFYVHNWTSEECAKAVEWYEEVGQSIMPAQAFEHHQSETLRRAIAQRVVFDARQREIARYQRRHGNRVYVH